MASAVYQLIRDAVENKRQVVATYNGHVRQMCPHCLGHKNGKEQCLFYQFGGGSDTGLGAPGSSANWRCIPLAGLVNVTVQDGEWHTGAGHSRPQTCVGKIDVEVRF